VTFDSAEEKSSTTEFMARSGPAATRRLDLEYRTTLPLVPRGMYHSVMVGGWRNSAGAALDSHNNQLGSCFSVGSIDGGFGSVRFSTASTEKSM
jgi:hypothetical protein